MSDHLSRPVYDDIAAEARDDWSAEHPQADLPQECSWCRRLLDDCECR